MDIEAIFYAIVCVAAYILLGFLALVVIVFFLFAGWLLLKGLFDPVSAEKGDPISQTKGYPLVINAILSPAALLIWIRGALFVIFFIIHLIFGKILDGSIPIGGIVYKIATFDTFTFSESWPFWMLSIFFIIIVELTYINTSYGHNHQDNNMKKS